MKTWRQHIAWLCLVSNMLLFALVSSSYATPTPPVQGKVRAKSFPPAPPLQATTPGNYVTRVFTDAHDMQMTYYLFIPFNYNPQKKYPLVLLLHGGDERANVNNPPDQNRNVLLNQDYVKVWGPGIPGLSSPDVQAQYPTFIVVPQVDDPQHWVDVPASQGSYTLAAQPTDSLRMAKEIVDALQKQYLNIDSHRLYITGLSMGGYGTWDAIERWPGYFAAAAPLAGAGDPSKASRLVSLPIWAFHGSGDGGVPVSGSRDMIQAIKVAGGHPRYTEYASAGHEIWAQVYSTPAFFSWLFSQHNSYPRPGSTHRLGRSAASSLLKTLETWFRSLLRMVEIWLGGLFKTVEIWFGCLLRALETCFSTFYRMVEIWFGNLLRTIKIRFGGLLRTSEAWFGGSLKTVEVQLGSLLKAIEIWFGGLLRIVETWFGSLLRMLEVWFDSSLSTLEIWLGSLLKTLETWFRAIFF